MYKIFDKISYTVLNKGKEFVIEGIDYDSRKLGKILYLLQ